MDERLKTLTSLAILKVDLDEGRRDYIDYLQSFALHALHTHSPDPISDETLRDLLRQEFGLNVPTKGCQLVLRRLVKRGYLKKDGYIYTAEGELPSIDFDARRNSARHDIEAVYTRLVEFVRKEFELEWTNQIASNALLGFLSQFGIEFLRAYVFKTALPEVPATAPHDQYVISRFIQHLHSHSDPLFECVSILVKGQMYANALVCPDLESLEKKFNGVTFYLDTPLILNILSIQGKEEYSATQELLDLVARLRGRLAVFEHTIDEVKGILSFAERNLDNAAVEGRVLREIRATGMKRSDLILLKENLVDTLNTHGIKAAKTPSYVAKYQISEAELHDAIDEHISYINPRAVEYDINSVRSIYVLREGSVPRRLEDAAAVFVTPNSGFARAAYSLGKNHNSTREVSSVITDYGLANVAWLKAPLGAPDLPEKELMAACYAAMEPKSSLWAKYLAEIDKLENAKQISADDHAILRVSPLATDELMNLTLGNEEALTGTSVRKILERVKKDLVKEKDKDIARERAERSAVVAERDRWEQESQQLHANLYWIADRIAGFGAFFFEVFVLVVAIGAVIVAPFLTTSFVAHSHALTSIALGVVLLAGMWGVTNWYFGTSFRSISRSIRRKLRGAVMRRLTRKAKPAE